MRIISNSSGQLEESRIADTSIEHRIHLPIEEPVSAYVPIFLPYPLTIKPRATHIQHIMGSLSRRRSHSRTECLHIHVDAIEKHPAQSGIEVFPYWNTQKGQQSPEHSTHRNQMKYIYNQNSKDMKANTFNHEIYILSKKKNPKKRDPEP